MCQKKREASKNKPPKPLVYLGSNINLLNQNWTPFRMPRTYEQEKNNLN
jgi:hypothetical protein